MTSVGGGAKPEPRSRHRRRRGRSFIKADLSTSPHTGADRIGIQDFCPHFDRASTAERRQRHEDMMTNPPAAAARLTTSAIGRLQEACRQVLIESLRQHRVLVILVVAYWAACQVTGWLSGGMPVVSTVPFAGGVAVWVLLLVASRGVTDAASTLARRRSPRQLDAPLWCETGDRFLSAERAAKILTPALFSQLFFTTFSSFKRLLPYVNAYQWDPTLMQWDRALHGGVQPWQWLQPILGTPLVTSAISVLYNLWPFVMFGTFFWQAASLRRPQLREQFLASFVFCWIIVGTAAALYLSSVGPCYYGRVTGLDDPYAPLLAYLRDAAESYPVWSVAVQDLLWNSYVNHWTMLGGGISAMPSMHVAISVLLACLGWGVNRWAGICYTLYAAIILVGSVHLGWHYAIDGYAAAIFSVALWRATGWAARRHRIA
jgi:hypothetical protein